jgi:hypothetical protein
VDTQLVAGLISHWTVTLEWPSAVRALVRHSCIPNSHTGNTGTQGGTLRTIRLTLNQYALLSVLSNTKVYIFFIYSLYEYIDLVMDAIC